MVKFDASPWGGGAALYRRGDPIEFFSIAWTDKHAKQVGEVVGQPAGQSTWEYLTLYIALRVWGTGLRERGLSLVGDNTSALSAAISGKGKKGMNRISCELSWRKVRQGWRFVVAHLASEQNTTADQLSRLHATGTEAAKGFPEELLSATRREDLHEDDWWHCK